VGYKSFDAIDLPAKQAQTREKCCFPAKELREYREFLSKKATYATARDLTADHIAEEVVLIDKMRRLHEENHDCYCWYTRDELEAQLRLERGDAR
jgi:exonuclease III